MQKSIDEIARDLAHNLSPDELRERWLQRSGDAMPTAQITQVEREYWQTVFAPRNPSESMPIRALKQEMDYETARRKFWAILQFRAATIETLTDQPFAWIFSEQEKEVLQNLIRYFINDPESKYPLTKGLFLYGEPGTGKTEMMEAFQKLCEQEGIQKGFAWTSMSRIYVQAKTDKDFDPIAEPVTLNRALDEFGRYTGGIIRFGDSLDINEAVIENRYERFMRYGQFSYFIANATPNELQEKFTPMILDRLRAMCTGVHFTGKSKRK